MKPVFTCLAALVACAQGSNTTRSLGAETWTVTNEHGNVTVPGKFPSQVHLDLYAAQAISKLVTTINGRCVAHPHR